MGGLRKNELNSISWQHWICLSPRRFTIDAMLAINIRAISIFRSALFLYSIGNSKTAIKWNFIIIMSTNSNTVRLGIDLSLDECLLKYKKFKITLNYSISVWTNRFL
jgi:hypothetical protein